MFRDKKKVSIHFIGVGGIGMSGIAEILLTQGYSVSGSDITNGPSLELLRQKGARIFVGHRKENIEGATVVVYSSAINQENPEIVETKRRKIPLIRRAEMLAELMRLKYGIAVAGSHGKTTTTSMIATILREGKLDPTHVIGGVVQNLGGHALLGKGNFLVAEADESDGSFLLLSPVLSVITNIDNDHLDFYKEEEKILEAFVEFANKIPFYGSCALNINDKNILKVRELIKKPILTFGFKTDGNEVDYEARNCVYEKNSTSYDLYFRGDFKIKIKLQTPGQHNILNSLGAIAIAHQLDLSFETIAEGLLKFLGVQRRFQSIYKNDQFEMIDDYAHHPTEIKATISTVTETSKSKVIVFFEPHRFSRTQNNWKDFLHAFNKANKVYISPIYPASEQPIEGINSERLIADINNLHPNLANYLPDLGDIYRVVTEEIKSGQDTTFLFLGAGTISKKAKESVALIKNNK